MLPERYMSRIDIMTPSRAQAVIDGLYRDVERHIAVSPPGLCPVDLAMNFLNLRHTQICGKCVTLPRRARPALQPDGAGAGRQGDDGGHCPHRAHGARDHVLNQYHLTDINHISLSDNPLEV